MRRVPHGRLHQRSVERQDRHEVRGRVDEDDRLIGVVLLDESDDVLLATRQGKAIRFAGDDVREFQSRNSTGVRGMRLADGDEVISLSILHRGGMRDQDEREDYLRFAPWKAEKEGAPGNDRRPLRRACRPRTIHPDGLRQRLWQAVVGL